MPILKSEPAATALVEPKPTHCTLVIAGDSLSGNSICNAIALGGQGGVGQVATLQQATELAAAGEAHAVLIVLPMPGLASAGLLAQIYANLRLPIVLMADQIETELIDRCAETGVFGCVSVATPPAMLTATLLLAIRRHVSHARLEADRDQLADQARQLLLTLENRKIIERAKGIYMRVLGLQEADAHRRLQQESQRRRLTITDLARKIIESDELLGPGERTQSLGRHRTE